MTHDEHLNLRHCLLLTASTSLFIEHELDVLVSTAIDKQARHHESSRACGRQSEQQKASIVSCRSSYPVGFRN